MIRNSAGKLADASISRASRLAVLGQMREALTRVQARHQSRYAELQKTPNIGEKIPPIYSVPQNGATGEWSIQQ